MNPQFNQPKGSTAKEINKNPRELWRRALSDLGLNLVEGSFEDGATVTTATDAVWDINGAQCYTWGGSLPKTVNKNSTPESAGGTGLGKWVSVGDMSLRDNLLNSSNDNYGDALIAVKQPYTTAISRTQHDKNAETLSIRDFYNPADTDWTNAFKKAARVSADEGKVIFVPAGKYIVSDSIPLYDDGHVAVPAPDVQSYYKGNGTKFRGEGRKTVIIKTSASTKDINAVFYIDSTNAVPSENGKRGMEISHMSIIDLTDYSVGIYNNNGVVCSHFEDLFIMPRRVGVWLGGSFVDVTLHGIIVQGHDDSVTYPMDYGFRVGSGSGTSISMDRCHVGHAVQDAYEIRSQYSEIGVLSADNTGGVVYSFNEFRGHIQSLGSEWATAGAQNGTLLKAVKSQFSVGLVSMLKKIVNEGSQLFDLDSSQINIDQVNATDSCVFSGKPARLRNSSLIDIGYFTQYKYEQFVQPIDYDANTNTFMTVGNLGGTQYRGRQDISIHGNFAIPYAQPTSECYRIMGTKSIAAQSGCVGTIISLRGRDLTRSAVIMDVVCNGNGNIGTSANAVKRAVSDPVGLTAYSGWYEGTIDGVLYMLLRMDTDGDKNLGSFFSGVTIGRDPNLFRVVTPDEITGLVVSSIGTMKTETAS
ncbi:hypothetical protein [Salmonella phage SKML-39]|uniref:Tail spike TSP1/Gp66 N-terminal domain-containing protein n=1 Tax=Salmonella phage SKML-39 TaxID=1204528 RepID=K4I3A9_9CAUD|nr:hypothetical protein G178_gp208 [Salmonella phage SKML-39]AFU64551.1 hypothetical protein [Salmonella phage SKML-39]